MRDPHLPPSIELLCVENIKEQTLEEAIRSFRQLLPELQRQAEWTVNHYEYFDKAPSTNEFVAAPVGGLNPFSWHGKCNEPPCRLENARSFARTLGLYADRIIVPDPVTTAFIGDQAEWDDDALVIRFLSDILVLQELKPLADAGIINFTTSSINYCSSCYTKLKGQTNKLVNNLIDDGAEFPWLKVGDREYAFDTGDLHDPPLMFTTRTEKTRMSKKQARSIITDELSDEMIEMLLSFSGKTTTSSAVFSNSRLALLGLRGLEGTAVSARDVAHWEAAHSANLPWIGDLSVDQVLRLRQEAASALPSLRERLARNVGGQGGNGYGSFDEIGVVQELRANAADVEAELAALDVAGSRRTANIAGALGLTVSVYGFGASMLTGVEAFGTLLTFLGLLHPMSRTERQQENALKSKPGYVFVKAKELLAHAK